MLNILHSIDTPGPGGAETVYFDIISGLNSTRFKSFPVIPSNGWLNQRLKGRGMSPIIINPKGSFNLGYLWNLIRVIHKYRIDIIHSHLFGSNVYCSLAGILTSTPVISTFHGFVDAADTEKALRGKFAIINKGSKKIVFVSKQLENFFVQNHGVSQARTEVIYNGLDTTKFKPGKNNHIREQLGFESKDIIIGAIGNIRAAKRYDLLLGAAAEVKKHRLDVKFVIAGQGSGELHRELLALQKKLDLKETVFFLGFTTDIVRFLHGIDLFVLSSESEGFSLSLIEAMACGLPVIATRCGGPEEILCSKKEGMLVDEKNPESIARCILTVASSLRTSEKNTNYVSSCIEQRFNVRLMIDRYSKLYEEIEDDRQ